jgi:hypothetical protein
MGIYMWVDYQIGTIDIIKPIMFHLIIQWISSVNKMIKIIKYAKSQNCQWGGYWILHMYDE